MSKSKRSWFTGTSIGQKNPQRKLLNTRDQAEREAFYVAIDADAPLERHIAAGYLKHPQSGLYQVPKE